MVEIIFIYTRMEREIHRLERLISQKQQTIKQLTKTNNELEANLSAANKQIESMKEKAILNFQYRNVPDREIIQTLEAKIAASAWQILQLQKINMKYEQSIIKLQQQIFAYQRQLSILQTQSSNSNLIQPIQQMEIQMAHVMAEWKEEIEEKEKLIEENLMLKESLKVKQSETPEKIAFYLNEVINLSEKIKNQQLNQKTRFTEFENSIKELKKENEALRQTLNKKNQQVMVLYQQSKMITTTKAEDLHTIRNLRAEIKKISQQYLKILSRLNQTEQKKVQMLQYHEACAKRLEEFEKLSTNYEATQKQNGILKEKLKKEELRRKAVEAVIQEANQKLYELLVENQACHEILYEARGYSNFFIKDIENKVEKFLKDLEKRRQNCDKWLDVNELIQVNQRLRVKSFIDLTQ